MFQLDRLLESGSEKQDYPATVLGKAYGTAVQSYLTYQDSDRAIYEGWMAYNPVVEDDKRNEEVFIALFLASIPKLEEILADWEVSTFHNKPATELSFRLDIDSTFYYVGYIDAVLHNRWNNRHAVLEVKSTSLGLTDLSPLYQNSGQALGYSIVLDEIVGQALSQYDLLYSVGQLGRKAFDSTIHFLTFPKTLLDRLNWFITLSMDVEHLHTMLEANVFPMRGNSCLQYMRPCKHFGTCSLHALDIPRQEEDDEIVYDFVYTLDTLIDSHLSRIQQGE
jgi:hypothetical protein